MKDKLFELFETNGELQIGTVALHISMAAVLGFLIFVSYYITHRGTIYSKKFNASLVVLTVLTGTVMTVIGNNIALSLGMVGALSIVRFRTAIKDPRDTAYIFWAIAVGVCCGVSDYLIAGIGTFIIFMFLILFGFIKDNERILIIVRLDSAALEAVESKIDSMFEGKAVLRVQNHSVSEAKAEVIYEVSDLQLQKAEKMNGICVKNISDISGVQAVNLVRQDDEINQ